MTENRNFRFREKGYIRIKVLSMGDQKCGKSCLIKRHCEHKFVSKYIPTIGVDFGVRPVTVDDRVVKVNFWDLSGNADYEDIRNEFYNETQGLILVFDVTSKNSLSNLDTWIREMKEHSNTLPLAGIVCGNKADSKRRAISAADANKWAKLRGYRYFETSANTGQNVDEAFNSLYHSIIERLEEDAADLL
mmetsp:Transcript_7777/g.14459  ORF Transcript_7777/g.14459 Transcript_7777/m.14459 type:complete len:190 (-) Transcript_7777:128-697(-)|eukprot:CAMPEP_0197520036 /NCGR_PEP_ID=MMETSP1318-20131121/5323_1 /TAXON_ID=552666 /ORGANISM="Partenskyella glossopodia, Strain RCC365" /LENGTH=189 /DNA_ID=CAMNT_0043071371 /DNA_START=233 /DNA_END=802 /DNA_ORIENTATION=-